VDAEPLHDLSAVRLDRLHGEIEEDGDLLRGFPLGHELQDFPLPRRQARERIGPADADWT
jgi:hypothetical protein